MCLSLRRVEVRENGQWWRLCQTESQVPVGEGRRLSSDPVDCDREGMQAQHCKIFSFPKKSMNIFYLKHPSFKTLSKSTKQLG